MKTAEWNRIRRQEKARFEKAGITYCQLCGSHSGGVLGLSFAHARKRRFLITDEDKRTVALLCVMPCHEQLELGPKDVMEETVTRLHAQVFETRD